MLTPAAAPVAASGHTIDFAESSIFLTASVDEISGLGAPFFTATPTATDASGVAVLSTTLPEASTSGKGGWTIGTSNKSPRTTCCLVPPPEPNVAFTLKPVFFSKPGMSFSTAARIPPGAIKVTSVCARATLEKLNAIATVAIGNIILLMTLLSKLRLTFNFCDWYESQTK